MCMLHENVREVCIVQMCILLCVYSAYISVVNLYDIYFSPLFNRMWRVVDLVEVALVVVVVVGSAVTVRGVAQEGEEDHAPLEEVVVDSEVARGSTREEVAAIEGLKGYKQSAMSTNIYSFVLHPFPPFPPNYPVAP